MAPENMAYMLVPFKRKSARRNARKFLQFGRCRDSTVRGSISSLFFCFFMLHETSARNPRVPCKSSVLPRLNLQLWRDSSKAAPTNNKKTGSSSFQHHIGRPSGGGGSFNAEDDVSIIFSFNNSNNVKSFTSNEKKTFTFFSNSTSSIQHLWRRVGGDIL